MRAINAIRELNDERDEPIRVIALYTETERHALFVRQSDERHCLGPAMVENGDGSSHSAYLDYELLERALVETGADAAWVGWGFVAEHPAFAELCERLGVVFVGPDADVMRALGDKIEAKKLAEEAGVPVAAWSGGPVESAEDAVAVGEKLGYPLMIKAAAGGGGRGMRRVTQPDDMAEAFERARAEAKQSFGDPSVLIESLVGNARHVEVQLMADGQGGVWALGVRDCSYQRRHQKVVEESASPALTAEQERDLAESAVRLARNANYRGAGTVEFLYEPEGQRFSFMEVNARLQVEHPVTEMVTGADLVRLQFHVASGGRLEGDPPPAGGHAIEVRLNAEDPGRGFAPAPGRITLLRLPSGPGVRVDTGVAEGDSVPPEFDSMIAKIIAHGATREQAIARLRRAVADTMVVIDEGTTNQGFLLELLGRPELRRGEVDTGWLDRLQGADEVQPVRHADTALIQAAIALCDAATATERGRFYALARRGRPHAEADICRTVDLLHRGASYRFGVCQVGPARYLVEVDDVRIEADVEWVSEHERRLSYGGRSFRTMTALQDNDLLVEVNGVPHRVSRDEGGLVRSHAPGVVVAIRVSEGDEVQAGDVVAVTESMKMESSLVAPVSGRVREVLVSANVQVPGGRPLVQIDPQDDSPAAVEGERVTFDAGDPEPGGGPSGLERLRRLALGYDVTPAEAKRVVGEVMASPADLEREGRLLEVYADVRALNRPHAEREHGGEALASPQEHLHAFLRSLDAKAEGLPDRFVAQLERALGHLGVTGLERTAALEDAAYRLFLAQQRAGTARDAVRALLARRLEQGEQLEGEAADAFRSVLDRLEAALAPREPALAELARELRWRTCDRPAVEAAREDTYAEAREHLAALVERPDAADREAHVQALVDCPQPLARLLTQGTDDFLLEALTRRYYRIRALDGLERREVDGVPFLLTSYVHEGTRHHVAAAFAEPDRLPAALAALATHAGSLPAGEPLAGDFYGTVGTGGRRRARGRRGPAAERGAARLRLTGRGARGRGDELHARGGRRPRGEPRPARPASDDGAAHGPVAARELRARAPPVRPRRLPLPRPGARQRARRAPRRGRRGPRPHPGARRVRPDRRPARPRAHRPPGVRGDARRPVAARPPRPPAVEPRAALRLARGGVRARRGPRGHHAPGADVRRARDRDGAAAGRRPRPALLQPRRPRRRGRGRRAADAAAAAARRGRQPDRLGPSPRHGPPGRDHQDPRAPEPAARRRDPARRVHRVRPRRRRPARGGRPPGRHQPREHRGRGDPQPHRALPGGDAARRAAGRPDPRARLAGRARVQPRDRRARPRRGARRAGRVVRALLRRAHRDGLGHREHGLGGGGAAPHRRLHAGGRRDQRRGDRHQRRRPAVLERRGHDADAHQGHPRDDARERDGADRQAGARLLRRRLGGGQLRHRRLRARHGPERAGAVPRARSRRRLRGAAQLLRARLRRARRALPAPRRDDGPQRPRRRQLAARGAGLRPHDGRRDLRRGDEPRPQEAVRHPRGDARRRRRRPSAARALGGHARGGDRRHLGRAPRRLARRRCWASSAGRCRASARSRPTGPSSGRRARCSRSPPRRSRARSTPRPGGARSSCSPTSPGSTARPSRCGGCSSSTAPRSGARS